MVCFECPLQFEELDAFAKFLQAASLFGTDNIRAESTKGWDRRQVLYHMSSRLFPQHIRNLATTIRVMMNAFHHDGDHSEGKYKVKKDYRDW